MVKKDFCIVNVSDSRNYLYSSFGNKLHLKALTRYFKTDLTIWFSINWQFFEIINASIDILDHLTKIPIGFGNFSKY